MTYKTDNQNRMFVWHHWPAIERHPRLVFEEFSFPESSMVRYYLKRGKPFTVVISPSEKEQHNGR